MSENVQSDPGAVDTSTADADAAFDAIEAPEAVAPESSPEEQPKQAAEGQSRDEQGRFAPKEAAKESTDESESLDVAAEAEPEDQAKEVQFPPWKYKADGQELELPGSMHGSEGVLIPTEKIPWLQEQLAEAEAHRGSFQRILADKDRTVVQERQAREAAEAQAAFIIDKFDQMIETGTMDDWLDQQRTNWPVLKAQAEAASVRQKAEADRRLLEELQQEREMVTLRPQMDAALDESVEKYGKGLDAETISQLKRQLRSPRYEGKLFFRSDGQDGHPKGAMLIDYSLIEGVVEDTRQIVSRIAPQREKIARAAAQNATKAPEPPPTVSSKGNVAPGKQVKEPDFSKEDDPTSAVDKFFLSNW